MVKISTSLAAVAVAATQLVTAQTFSECDPTKKSGCAPRKGLNQAEYSVDFKATKGQGADTVWGNMAKAVTFGDNGAEFTLAATGDSVTYATDFYIFFGYVEVKMRAAPGAGIVSSFVLQSDDLDEIDWEMIGSETDKVQSNYFGKGNTTTYDRGAFHNVQTPADVAHTYALNWTQESTTWLIDGAPVRTVKYADALGGLNYPQTPMNIRLGNWIAGTPGNSPGTITWAGGQADLSKAPFSMYVESVKIKNYNPAAAYEYGDQTGNFQSIKYSNVTPVAAPAPIAGSNSTVSAASVPAPAGSAGAIAASANGGQQKAASSSLAAAASGSAASGKPNNPGKHGDAGNDDDDCDGMDDDNAAPGLAASATGKPAAPVGTVTVTPNAGGDAQGTSTPAAAVVSPSAAGLNINTDAGGAGGDDSSPSTTLSSSIVSSSMPAVAVVTASSSPSAVVSFPLGNGSAVNTYTPAQVSTSAAASSRRAEAVSLVVAAAVAAGLSAMVGMAL